MLIICRQCTHVIRSAHNRSAAVKYTLCFRCLRISDKKNSEKDRFIRLLEKGAKQNASR